MAHFLGRLFKKESVYYDVPKRTVLLAHVRSHQCIWQKGTRGNHPMTLMNGEAVITNATKERLRIVGVVTKRPPLEGQVWVKSQLAPSYGARKPVDIPSRATADLSFYFQFDRLKPKPGKRVTLQVGFVDHYGNKNWHTVVFAPVDARGE